MIKILLIEDETALREIIADELSNRGYAVTEAGNGEEGLKKLEDSLPDLVICDRAMPGLSGYDVLDHIRKVHPHYERIPFVFLSALTDQRDKLAVEHLRPAAYIEKPVDLNTLDEKIKALLRKR